MMFLAHNDLPMNGVRYQFLGGDHNCLLNFFVLVVLNIVLPPQMTDSVARPFSPLSRAGI